MRRRCVVNHFRSIGVMAILMGASLLTYAQENQPIITSSLEFERAEYGASDPVNFRFSLTNHTAQPLTVLTWYTPLEGFRSDLFTVEPVGGEAVQYIGILATRLEPGHDSYVTFKPGQTHSVTIDLAKAYAAVTAGAYQVTYQPEFQVLVGEKPKEISRLHDRTTIVKLPPNKGRFKLLEPRQRPEYGKPVSTESDNLPRYNENCSEQQKQILNERMVRATEQATDAHEAMEETKFPFGAQSYLTWFGCYDDRRYQTVTENYKKIKNALANPGQYTFNCDPVSLPTCISTCISCCVGGCVPNLVAYVNPTIPFVVNICPAYFEPETTRSHEDDWRAATLIHETSHFTAVASTRDYEYTYNGCKTLAATDPARAIENAQSYKWFVYYPIEMEGEALYNIYPKSPSGEIYVAWLANGVWCGNQPLLGDLTPISSNQRPGVAYANNVQGGKKLVVTYKERNSTQLKTLISKKGNQFENYGAQDAANTSSPTLLEYEGAMYLVYVQFEPNQDKGPLQMSRLGPKGWIGQEDITTKGQFVLSSTETASLAVYKKAIYLIYKDGKTDNLYITRREVHGHWEQAKPIVVNNIQIKSATPPGVVSYKDNLYMVYKGNKDQNNLYLSVARMDQNGTWIKNALIEPAPRSWITIDGAPGIGVINNKMYVVYRALHTNNLEELTYSDDGWSVEKEIEIRAAEGIPLRTIGSPSVTVVN